MTMSRTNGFDWTLPAAPPLVQPPLSLLKLSRSLVSVDQAVEARADTYERAASAQAGYEAASKRLEQGAGPAELHAAQAAVDEARTLADELRTLAALAADAVTDAQRWENGFEYLPELDNGTGLEVFAPGTGTPATDAALKSVVSTQTAKGWYDPFLTVAHDDRSLFGWPYTDYESRAQRALRALVAHEAWQVEREFWAGLSTPTNYHLSASPSTTTTSPHRTIDAWTNPTAAPGTVLGTVYGLQRSLAALDQAIAVSDAGTGMIHASPLVVQAWMQVYPYIRDSTGNVYTVNMNLIVPGYGYPGTGPDSTQRTVTDGVTASSTTVTSATAAFTSADAGKPISTPDLPAGTLIVSVTNGTTVIVSNTATASHSGQTLHIGGFADQSGSRYQWAYATDMTFTMAGAARTLPFDLRELSPESTVDNSADVRAERPWAVITNRLLRSAVLLDTQTI